jgi:uncharacterized phage protein (TIGR01671 family)
MFFSDDGWAEFWDRLPSDVEPMEFTGLHDLHGNEIYEGDIIRFADKQEWHRGELFKIWLEDPTRREEFLKSQPCHVEVVKWDGREARFDFNSPSDVGRYWEVVGNICENPELLTPGPPKG